METITAKCSCCGYEEEYELSPEESYSLRGYERYGTVFSLPGMGSGVIFRSPRNP